MSEVMKLLEAVAVRLQAKTPEEAFMSVIKIKELAEHQLRQAREEGRKEAAMDGLEYLEDWGNGVPHFVKDGFKKHFGLDRCRSGGSVPLVVVVS